MPISPEEFYNILAAEGIDFFTGVPDSLLKDLCACIDDNVPKEGHVIAANEGNAVAIAAGYHLATGKLPLVYMQNSGIGNAINPLLSLCDPSVYSLPMMILIGWRGEPGVPDEPQHTKQGKVQLDLLKLMDIPYVITSKDDQDIKRKILRCMKLALREDRPVVMLIRKGTFGQYGKKQTSRPEFSMTREEALDVILSQLDDRAIIVSTTGRTSREIFEIRERNGERHFKDFLTVGSMGHCSSIALGVAIAKPERNIISIDGDGALIMHMGGLATTGKVKPKNIKHILINNEVHESVGGQETAAKSIDFTGLAKSNGYENVYSVEDKDRLIELFDEFVRSKGPSFLEINVRPWSREDLGRPNIKPVDNKKAFMGFLNRP